MNAAERANSVSFAQALASATTLVRQHFPAVSVSLMPWREDQNTSRWLENESLDLAFYFPGWSPRLQCRCVLLQLIMSNSEATSLPYLLGVVMRGMTFEGERWQISTINDWEPHGSYLPDPSQKEHLHAICRDLFLLFPKTEPMNLCQ